MRGIVIFKSANKKSKSEGVFPYLYIGGGEFVKIVLVNDNPFANDGLKAYDSKKVIVEGELNELNTFIVSSIKEDCESVESENRKEKDISQDVEDDQENATAEAVGEVIKFSDEETPAE